MSALKKLLRRLIALLPAAGDSEARGADDDDGYDDTAPLVLIHRDADPAWPASGPGPDAPRPRRRSATASTE